MCLKTAEETDTEKETLLTETINELKKQIQELNEKKNGVQQNLNEIKSRLEVTQAEEHKTEERMKDIIKVEAKLEELMNEEERLLRQKSGAESELIEIKKKLDKIDELNKMIEGKDGTRDNTN